MSARHVAALAAGFALAACTLTGCRSHSNDPPPSPTPTYECTAPGTCTPQQAAKEQQAAKDHAAAEKALRAGITETYRILRNGGTTKPTSELRRTIAGSDLTSLMRQLRRFQEQDRVGHGKIIVETVRFKTPYPEQTQQLYVCENGTHWHTTDKNGKNATQHGVRQDYFVTMKRIDGLWKRVDTKGGGKVKTCDHD